MLLMEVFPYILFTVSLYLTWTDMFEILIISLCACCNWIVNVSQIFLVTCLQFHDLILLLNTSVLDSEVTTLKIKITSIAEFYSPNMKSCPCSIFLVSVARGNNGS